MNANKPSASHPVRVAIGGEFPKLFVRVFWPVVRLWTKYEREIEKLRQLLEAEERRVRVLASGCLQDDSLCMIDIGLRQQDGESD